MEPNVLGGGSEELVAKFKKIEWLSRHAFKITWADDHESVYPLDFLRLNCPCAVCKGHGLQTFKHLSRELLENPKESAPPATFTPVGRYAVGIIFADGHDTGIFSYRFLRRFCPCPECHPVEEGENEE